MAGSPLPTSPRSNERSNAMAVAQQLYQFVIDGREAGAASGRTATVTNPATGEGAASVPVADEQDEHRAVMAARRAFDEGPWPRMPARDGGRVLMRIAHLPRGRGVALAKAPVQRSGTPVRD